MSVAIPLAAEKFQDTSVTADGKTRASVSLIQLKTLWINTGTLCNLTCRNCYIESSPKNDRLEYITLGEVEAYLDEIETNNLGTSEIGFTGGEPFMNPDLPDMVDSALRRGFLVIVLTNAMKPMMKVSERLSSIGAEYGGLLTIRVSLDHYTKGGHELERGLRSWEPALEGLSWLTQTGLKNNVAGRTFTGEDEATARQGYAALFARLGVPLDAENPIDLVLFPEMDASQDVPEITIDCWGILNVDPSSVMCATSRMVVKRKGSAEPSVVACTLLPYEDAFEMSHSLQAAASAVSLNHPHCARFCVLGGATCSQG
jgi:hypothetical protein